MSRSFTILGAGISGISAAYHAQLAGNKATIYELRNRWGGLCDHFEIEGFRFDYFVHLSFTQNDYVKELFSKSTDYYTHHPESYNYYKGLWLKHPAQFNLHPLSIPDKVRVITDFVNRPKIENPANYKEWLVAGFGEYFAQTFPIAYTNKYWTIDAEKLTTDWVGKRMKEIALDEMLAGAFETTHENHYYASEMRYPKKGGYKAFLAFMANGLEINLNKKAILLDVKQKKIDFNDGTNVHYEHLISSMPLPQLVGITKDDPQNIKDAANKLLHTSGQLVSIGFNRPEITKHLWFYIYDTDILPARVYSPSLKSPENAPAGKSSLQFETYYSKYKNNSLVGQNLIEYVVENGQKMGLFTLNDIEITDYKHVPFANVVFDVHRAANVALIRQYYEQLGIKTIGRFGEWDYFWSDQSLMSGKKIVEVYN